MVDFGDLEKLTVKCSTCGDYGHVMDGGNMYDCPACNTGEDDVGVEADEENLIAPTDEEMYTNKRRK